jgi:biotin carboxyl carrier protein
MPRVRLRVPGRQEPVDVDLDPAAIVAASGGSGAVVSDGRVVPFHTASDGSTIEVWLAGRTWTFESASGSGRGSRRSAGAHAHAATSDEVTAPMPGTILEVLVKPGDAVKAHQPVVVMVSMKMEMSLGAPCAGRVAAVDCAAGRTVDMGQRLVKIDARDGDAA